MRVRLTIVSLMMLLFVKATFAQTDPQKVSAKLYFLNDPEDRWCAYTSESEWKLQVQSLKAHIAAQVDYVDDRISLIYVTKADEAGDWTVYDTYSLDKDQKLYTLRRIINILPGDRSEEETWSIQDGKVIKEHTAPAGASRP